MKKYLKFSQTKILLAELRTRHAIKTLPFRLKIVFLALAVIFSISAVCLIFQADRLLSVEVPAEGGVFIEGIVGTPRFINPVLTISDADRDVAMLVYSGLMRAKGSQLTPDLAEKYEIAEDGLCYKFFLKQNLKWSDGEPLISKDVVFTIEQIKLPLNKSPKRASWEGVIAQELDENTVQFCMEKPYAPFLENTTIGILPYHIWKDMLPEQMPLSDWNIKPIGSGPYKIQEVSRNASGIITSYALSSNEHFALNQPYIKKIILKFYPSEKKLMEAYKAGDVDSLSALSPKDFLVIKKEDSKLKTYPLPRIFAVFFNQDSMPLFVLKEVREALGISVDKRSIVQKVLENFGTEINSPLPPGIFGGAVGVEETDGGQIDKARNLLEKNGWKMNEAEKVLEKTQKKKESIKLKFTLATSNMPDLVQTGQLLKEMWEKLGAQVDLKIYETGDLEQNVIRPRKYDALLFGEVLGRDPDAFAFWHSSQRNDPGLNIALYANLAVDKILEKIRSAFDSKEREKEYEKLQKEIQKDMPAVFLYTPYFIHLTPVDLRGLDENFISVSSERFSQINNWSLRTKRVWKIFAD